MPALELEIARHLPTPAVKLLSRANNACSPERQHGYTFQAYEIWLFMVSAVLLARYRASARRVDALERLVATLTPVSLGKLASFARSYASEFSDDPIAPALRVALGAEARGTYDFVCGETGRTPQRHPDAAELMDALASYRNRVIAHAGTRETDFYETAADRLFPGIVALLDLARSSLGGTIATSGTSSSSPRASAAPGFMTCRATRRRSFRRP
jgi:hypothetical protein